MGKSATTPREPEPEPVEAEEEEAQGEGAEEQWLAEARECFTPEDWEEFELSDEKYDAMSADEVVEHWAGIRERVKQRKAEINAADEEKGGDAEEEGGNEEGEEDEEEEDDDDDDDEEEGEGGEDDGLAHLAKGAAAVEATAAEELQPEDVNESYFIFFKAAHWGVPDEYIVHYAKEAIEFETAEKMNAMLTTKSANLGLPEVYLKHIWVVRANDRATPEGWYPGKDSRKLEDFPYRTFYYVATYVKPTPGDAESERKAAHDTMVFRMVHKQPARKLHEKFMGDKVQRSLTAERREQYQHVLDWAPGPGQGPPVDPKQERFNEYKGLALQTNYKQRDSTPRLKGPNHKLVKAGVVAPTAKGGKRPAASGKTERKKPKVVQDDDDDEDDDDEAPSHTGSDATIERHRVAAATYAGQVRPPKRVQYIQLVNPAKAHWFIVPDRGPNNDKHFLAIEEWE